MNVMDPKREQAGFAVTAFMDRIMQIPGMRERLEAAVRKTASDECKGMEPMNAGTGSGLAVQRTPFTTRA